MSQAPASDSPRWTRRARTNPPCPERHLIRSKEIHHERQDPLCRHGGACPGQFAGRRPGKPAPDPRRSQQGLGRGRGRRHAAQERLRLRRQRLQAALDAHPRRGHRRTAGAARPGADRPAGQPQLQPRRHGDAARLDASPGAGQGRGHRRASATARCAAPTTTTKSCTPSAAFRSARRPRSWPVPPVSARAAELFRLQRKPPSGGFFLAGASSRTRTAEPTRAKVPSDNRRMLARMGETHHPDW